MIVVADSSPLRYLIVIGQQNLLPILFSEAWIPLAVLAETLDRVNSSRYPRLYRLVAKVAPSPRSGARGVGADRADRPWS